MIPIQDTEIGEQIEEDEKKGHRKAEEKINWRNSRGS
jgi:hypothetical protein